MKDVADEVVKRLIEKARDADSSDDALKFSQAALNTANAAAKSQE